ncbi:hypothetical protein LEP1GSC088_1603 [Leptospira interrogans str. L1207]|nr:hypothetical protein LEP1GSC088_1603 [Leptospira interrogans str. L1207]
MKRNQFYLLTLGIICFQKRTMNPELSEKKLNSIELRTGSREKLDSFYLEK